MKYMTKTPPTYVVCASIMFNQKALFTAIPIEEV